MDFDDYQDIAGQFAIYPKDMAIIYPALGLASEAGEVCDKIKKSIRDGKPFDIDGIEKELGDVLWYVAVLADDLDLTLSGVAVENIYKLRSRKERNVLQGSGDNR